MNCPRCVHAALQMTVRQGVEIDYCPECNGIWLDNGELNKIINRSTAKKKVTQQNTNMYTKSVHTSKSKKVKVASTVVDSLFDLLDFGD